MGERCQFVFTIAAESLSPVMFAVESCLSDQAYSIAACRSAADGFTELSDDLGDTVTKLEKGEFRTILFRPDKGPIEFSLVHHPSVSGRTLSLYSATFEYTSRNWPVLWNLLLNRPGLRVVSLGMEEGVELSDDMLSPASFPWNKWPVIIAAVRSDKFDAQWVIAEGPEMKGRVRSDGAGASRF